MSAEWGSYRCASYFDANTSDSVRIVTNTPIIYNSANILLGAEVYLPISRIVCGLVCTF